MFPWQDGPSSASRKASDAAVAAGSGKAQVASKAPSAAAPKATPARAAPAKRKKGRDEVLVKLSEYKYSVQACMSSTHALHSKVVKCSRVWQVHVLFVYLHNTRVCCRWPMCWLTH